MTEFPSSTSEPKRHPLPSALLHDLRTPLNHIIGYSELMMERTQEEDCTALLPHLQKVRAAARHMADLLDENFEPEIGGEPVGEAAVGEEEAPRRR